MNKHTRHYINGRWVESIGGTLHHVINPATEQPCAEVVFGTREDVDAAVAAARAAFETFSQTGKEERLALLDRIMEEYQKRQPDLARSLSEEMGAPIGLASTLQVGVGLGGFAGTRQALESFRFTEDCGTHQVVYEPIGVVGMITPWNWPLNQIALKVAPCIAAGNTMVLKPSEQCPGNAAIVAEIMHAAGVPAGVFNLVQGDGPTVGEAIASHPDIDMVSFTGSTRAGIQVARAAAGTVKRVHQELGGKCPNLVLPGADLAAVLPTTVAGVWVNSGQSCISPSRILVHKDQEADAIRVITGIMQAIPVGDPMQEGAHIGPVVNRAQFEKIQGLIQKGLDEGARLECGGLGRPDGVQQGYFVKPTVFSGVTPGMTIAREEIFGPVACILTYGDLDEAVRIANDTHYGLLACISGDPAAAARIAPRLRAGMVTINDWVPAQGSPFGGYKQSGNGREAGQFGLKDFMEIKSISGLPA